MSRFVMSLIAVAAALTTSNAFAQPVVRVDGVRLPVPPELREAWRQVQNANEWTTDNGRVISGTLDRFVCREIAFLPASEAPMRPARVRVIWFEGGDCRRMTRAIEDLDRRRARNLSRLFGARLEDLTGRRILQVVFAEFDGEISPPPENEGGEGETGGGGGGRGEGGGGERRGGGGEGERRGGGGGEGERRGGEGGEDDDGEEGETGGRGEGERPENVRIPVRLLDEDGRRQLRPFADMARNSFQRRLAASECVRSGGGDEEEEDGSDDGGGTGSLVAATATAAETRTNNREDEETDGDNEEGENGDLRRFGFTVIKFVAAAGSLEFEEDSRRRICIRAPSPRAAIRRVRERFPNQAGEVDEERISHRIVPNPRACVERQPENGGPRGDEQDDDAAAALEPVPDPLSTEADQIESAIPLS